MAGTRVVFRRMLKAAGSVARDRSRTMTLAADAARLAHEHQNPLRGALENLTSLIRLIRAWATGTYRDVPWRSLIYAVAAVLYFVSPIDAIPDFIPIIGYVDDVMVIAWVATAIGKDLQRFQDWEAGLTA